MENDSASLVMQIYTALQPYLTIIATKAAEKIGESIPENIGKLWQSIKAKFTKKKATRESMEDLIKNPDDPDIQAAFRVQLKKLIDEDEAFKSKVTEIIVNLDINANIRNEGSGAVALGTSTALGEKSQQINAPVQGDVLGSGSQKSTTQINILVKEDDEDSHSIKLAYLNHVFESKKHLSLAGIDPKAASNEAEARMNLSQVYTALQTTKLKMTPSGKSAITYKQIPVLEAINSQQYFVLLGDPGSGKSTFLNFLAMCLAGELIHSEEANLRILTQPIPHKTTGRIGLGHQTWEHGALIPIHVTLRDFVARGLGDTSQKGTAKQLWSFICDELEQAALGGFKDVLYRELLNNQCILLLDGLDEVPEGNKRRAQIKDVIEDFAKTFFKCRIVVTSRTYAYQSQEWRLQEFQDSILASFGKGQIRHFIDRWYDHIAILRGIKGEDAKGRAEILKSAVFRSDRLLSLAERPLLLTLMASLHAWRGGSLPEKREELYSDAVNLLLDWWESPKVVRDSTGKAIVLHPSLGEWLKIDRDKVRDFINQLAYEAHLSQPELRGTADVLEENLVSGLMRLSKNPDVNPVRLIEYLSQRAGLLIPKGIGVYTFPHRTFQEYLSACHLTDHGYPDLIAKLAIEDADRWREVILLAAAKAARGSTYAFWALVDTLVSPEIDGHNTSKCWGAHLAGQITYETADFNHLSERESLKLELVRKWHLALIASDVFPAPERVLAGKNLFKMGDSRFDPDAWFLPNDPMLGLVEIKDGIFLFGKDSVEVGLESFLIARYLTTIDQYNMFIRDSNYQSQKIRGIIPGIGNEPVSGIAWYDAVPYCEWLNTKLNNAKNISERLMRYLEQGGHITLPDEQEWEKAAKGGLELVDQNGQVCSNSLPNRIFPWGDNGEENNANTSNTRIKAASPVGCFSVGASPYGIQDLSGNVWEWTRSKFDPEEVDEVSTGHYVMRGGTYGGNLYLATCNSRVRGNPSTGTKGRGFRIVITTRP